MEKSVSGDAVRKDAIFLSFGGCVLPNTLQRNTGVSLVVAVLTY